MYTSDLEQAVRVSSKKCFPVISGTEQERYSILDQHKQLHWGDWINESILYSLEPSYPAIERENFNVTVDTDATIIHTDTLKVLNQGFMLSAVPKFDGKVPKIKHSYQGVTLHKVVHIELG